MALFNRDYDRDYGYRGTTGYRGGYDRDMGDRSGSWWERTKNRTSNAFGSNDYDRGYRGYDRGFGGTTTGRYGRGTGATTGSTGQYGTTGYAGTTGNYGSTGYDRGFTGTNRYDQGFAGTNRYARGDYGEGYKSRAQTDTGDPFGDRQSGTPIRMVRQRDEGGWFGWGSNDQDRDQRYDQGYRGTTYDQDYSSNPVGYDPYYGGRYSTGRKVNEYEGQHRYGARGYDRGYRGGATRDYDRGWF